MAYKIVVLGSLASSLVNFRYSLIQRFVASGNEVIACAPNADDDTIAKLAEIGVKYQHIPIENTGLNPFRDIMNCMKMATVFRKTRPDYIISYTMKPVIYGSLAARMANVKQIYSMITGLGYGFTSQTTKAKIVGFIMSGLLKMALYFNKGVFFQNPDDIEIFKEKNILKNIDKIQLINGSGVDLDYYKKCPLPENQSFLLVARLIKDKGIYEYVEAARIVQKQYPDIKFNLAGWFDRNPSSIKKETVDSWTEEGVINYLGSLEDVRPAIQECSIYVLPSYREGTPRTVLEAMSIGRPIITSDAPGCRETVKEGENGFLVPIKDHIYLANRMIDLLKAPEKIYEMSEKSYNLAVEKYDVHKVNTVILKKMGLEH